VLGGEGGKIEKKKKKKRWSGENGKVGNVTAGIGKWKEKGGRRIRGREGGEEGRLPPYSCLNLGASGIK